MPKKLYVKKRRYQEHLRNQTVNGRINDPKTGEWREARNEEERASRDMVRAGYHL